MTTTAPSLFQQAIRVYSEDTDAGGVVFHANYLKLFERARTEWLRSLSVEQQVLRDRLGAIFVVTDTQVRFHDPARLDDLLDVRVPPVQPLRPLQPVHVRRASMQLAQQARCGTRLVTEGEIRIGCVDQHTFNQHTFKPRRLPAELLERLP